LVYSLPIHLIFTIRKHPLLFTAFVTLHPPFWAPLFWRATQLSLTFFGSLSSRSTITRPAAPDGVYSLPTLVPTFGKTPLPAISKYIN
jgi:hypothetical protein